MVMSISSGHTMHHQAANFICRKILSGEWRENEFIPDTTRLASILELNPHVIHRAIEFLAERKIIFEEAGKLKLTSDAKSKSLQLLREEFEEHDLPEVKRKMELLGLSMVDIQDILSKKFSGK